MPSSCCIVNCNSRSHDRHGIRQGMGFYRIPAWKKNSTSHVSEVTMRRRMAWIAAIRRPNVTFDKISPHMLVCSKHFHKGKPAYEMLECDPDWAPSLNLGHSEVRATSSDRFQRFSRRARSSQQPLNMKRQARKGNKTVACDNGGVGNGDAVDTSAENGILPVNLKRKRIYKVMLEDRASLGGTLEGSSQSEKKKLDIEGRYPQGSWEQATVEAIMNLRTFDKITTTSQIAQTIIANLKDENNFLRAQNIKRQWELKSMQKKHSADLQAAKDELLALKQRCTCTDDHSKTRPVVSIAPEAEVVEAVEIVHPGVSTLCLTQTGLTLLGRFL